MLTIVRGRFKSFSGAIPVNEKNPDQSSVEVRSTPRTSTQVLVIKALAKAQRTQRTPAAARAALARAWPERIDTDKQHAISSCLSVRILTGHDAGRRPAPRASVT